MICNECDGKMKCRMTLPLRLGRWRYREYQCQNGDCSNTLTFRTLEHPVGGWSRARETTAVKEARQRRNGAKTLGSKWWEKVSQP